MAYLLVLIFIWCAHIEYREYRREQRQQQAEAGAHLEKSWRGDRKPY